jgi:hypothetical protein
VQSPFPWWLGERSGISRTEVPNVGSAAGGAGHLGAPLGAVDHPGPRATAGSVTPHGETIAEAVPAVLTEVLLRRTLPTLLALAAVTATLLTVAHATAAGTGRERLPDLVQLLPTGLVVSLEPGMRDAYRLGFVSAVSNVGAGPLVLVGHRAHPGTGAMTADQVVRRGRGPQEVVPDAGELRYVTSSDHRHWHLLRFDRYELRRAGQRTVLLRDRKTGFCLGDRYADPQRALARAPAPVYRSRCGLGQPELLGIQEGISVGYGDDYAANLEGQDLPLKGLSAGRYVLVHRVNADHRLRESDYTNNAASLLLELRWRGRVPLLRILRQCPGDDRCDRRPTRAAPSRAGS